MTEQTKEILTENFNDSLYPTLQRRFQSVFIDTIAIIISMFLISTILGLFANTPSWLNAILFFAIWGLYEPLSTSLGCTFGNYLMKIRVRQINDISKPINIINAYLRYVTKLLLGWLSFLTIHLNQRKRAIHDLVGQSVMINI